MKVPKGDAVALKVSSKAGSTLFLKLEFIFPECGFYIDKQPQLYPLRCLRDDGCHAGRNCMEFLARRVQYLFETFPDVSVLLLYFRYHDRNGSHRAGLFHRDSQEPPRFITFNRAGWEKLKQKGTVFQWRIPNEVFLGTNIKPPEQKSLPMVNDSAI